MEQRQRQGHPEQLAAQQVEGSVEAVVEQRLQLRPLGLLAESEGFAAGAVAGAVSV